MFPPKHLTLPPLPTLVSVSPRAEITCRFVPGLNNVFNSAGLSCLSLSLPHLPIASRGISGESWDEDVGGRRVDERKWKTGCISVGEMKKEREGEEDKGKRATACSQSKKNGLKSMVISIIKGRERVTPQLQQKTDTCTYAAI
ncbi:hypothetical protein CHARACLAT_009582 [Characodon lateralis]|uniref:Uncharacterized protein n=1 Tax=Characodon lateralis TaxID=208331 RepID=A0ABU7EV47_9TELE|nr:hypothetical protein [Characodon lateralis]